MPPPLFLRHDFNNIIHGTAKGSTDLYKHIAADDGAIFAHFSYGSDADAGSLSEILFLHLPIDQQFKELLITCGHCVHLNSSYNRSRLPYLKLYYIFPGSSTDFRKNTAIAAILLFRQEWTPGFSDSA